MEAELKRLVDLMADLGFTEARAIHETTVGVIGKWDGQELELTFCLKKPGDAEQAMKGLEDGIRGQAAKGRQGRPSN